MTALAVQASAIGLWTISCNSLLKSAFMARKDTITPTLMGLFTLLVNIPLAVLLMGPPLKISTSHVARILLEFRELPGLSWLAMDFKHAGLGLASSAAYLMTFFLLLILLHRRVSIDLSRFRVTTIRSILAAALMVSTLYWLLPPGGLAPWKEISLALPLAGIVYLGTSFLSGSGEVREIFELAARKMRKK